MLSTPQKMARGIGVVILRMLAGEINPFTVQAEDAFLFLCLGNGVIAKWAEKAKPIEYRVWLRMWRTWQTSKKMTLYSRQWEA